MDIFEERSLFERLHKLERETKQMGLDISKLQTDTATLKTAVETLITGYKTLQAQIAALSPGSVTQDQLDAIDKTATDTVAEVTATLTPPATPATKKK
jgi:hypothetical protein